MMQSGSTLLWGATGTLLGLVVLASTLGSDPFVFAVLCLLLAFSVVGMVYGVWVAREATKRLYEPPRDRLKSRR